MAMPFQQRNTVLSNLNPFQEENGKQGSNLSDFVASNPHLAQTLQNMQYKSHFNLRFPVKLYNATCDELANFIQWSPEGNAIFIHSIQFEHKVMTQSPGLVKVCDFKNLKRQLRAYGFDIENCSTASLRSLDIEYIAFMKGVWQDTCKSCRCIYRCSNPEFLRGRPTLASNMRTLNCSRPKVNLLEREMIEKIHRGDYDDIMRQSMRADKSSASSNTLSVKEVPKDNYLPLQEILTPLSMEPQHKVKREKKKRNGAYTNPIQDKEIASSVASIEMNQEHESKFSNSGINMVQETAEPVIDSKNLLCNFTQNFIQKPSPIANNVFNTQLGLQTLYGNDNYKGLHPVIHSPNISMLSPVLQSNCMHQRTFVALQNNVPQLCPRPIANQQPNEFSRSFPYNTSLPHLWLPRQNLIYCNNTSSEYALMTPCASTITTYSNLKHFPKFDKYTRASNSPVPNYRSQFKPLCSSSPKKVMHEAIDLDESY